MKIGLVADPYEESHASGMGHVVLELMRHLPAASAEHEFIFYSSHPISRERVPGSFQNIPMPMGLVRKLLFFLFIKDAPDVLVSMVPMLPLVSLRARTVPMCQELGSQKIRPEGIRARALAFVRDQMLMRLAFARAVHIVAASEATKADILEFYSVKPEKITVIYDGFQDLGVCAGGSPVSAELKPYFFFAGKVKYRKNVHGIVAAFISFRERTGADCKLVIAGDYGGEYYQNLMQQLREHHLEHEVHFVGYATGAQMYAYYTGALACLFPSLNEGFGMPIIEAMSLGTPVITSNISSMAEVAGDAGLQVDPHDPEDISRAMERVWKDETLRQELVAKGKARAAQFSWDKAAAEYVALLESL